MKRINAKRFTVDSIACAIYWTIIYIPIFLYTSRSIDLALLGLGSAAVVEIVFGGLYGLFLDIFRQKVGLKNS